MHLTHWGRETHICVGKLAIIASDNGLSPGRRQAIMWTNAGILFIRTLGTNFSEIFKRNSLIFIQENAFENVVCEMASISSRPQWVKPPHELDHHSIVIKFSPWWRHQMEACSALLAICAGNSPVTGEFPAQRPVTRSFHVFFDLHLNKQLSKH